MANRFLLKQFGGDSSDNQVFGSFQTGNPQPTNDPTEIQSLPAWGGGWRDATNNATNIPRLEEMQGVQYVLCKAIKELYSEGIPLWSAGEEYYKNSIAGYVSGDEYGLYINLTGTNTENPPDEDTTNWKKLSLGGGSSLPLLLPMWSDHLLNDVSYLRADTFSWQNGAVYSAAYQYILSEYNNPIGELKTETIGSQTISYRESPNGLKICLPDQQTALIEAYDEVGVTWFYVLDMTNEQFKLPRTKFGFTGLRGTVGSYVPEALPNIVGSFTGLQPKNQTEIATADGAFEVSETYSTNAGNISATGAKISLNVNNAQSVYQDGAAVQPNATEMYLYFYVGRYDQSAVEQTAGINTELFNEKADTDLNNVSENIDYIVASGTSEDGSISYVLTKKGLLVHWGRYNSRNGDTTITFLHPYADANYIVTFSFENTTNTGNIIIRSMSANTKTETNFINTGSAVLGRTFIVIGKGAIE